MSLDELKSYVIKNLKKGFKEKTLREVIAKAGWTEKEVDGVFADEEVMTLIKRLLPDTQSKDINKISYKAEPSIRDADSKGGIKDHEPDDGQKKEATTSASSDTDLQPPSPDSSRLILFNDSNLSADLAAYVENSLREGFSKSSIRNIAVRAGWSAEDVDRLMEIN